MARFFPGKGDCVRHIRSFLLRLGGLFQHSRQEQDLTDEIEGNIAFHIEDNLRAGMPLKKPAARRFSGSVASRRAKQECRDRLGLPFLETFLYDLRYRRSIARQKPHVRGRRGRNSCVRYRRKYNYVYGGTGGSAAASALYPAQSLGRDI